MRRGALSFEDYYCEEENEGVKGSEGGRQRDVKNVKIETKCCSKSNDECFCYCLCILQCSFCGL
jgi:hypothetical protein